LNTQNKTIFSKESFLGLRVFCWMIVSLVLMIGDHQYGYFSHLKSFLSVIVSPIHYSVNVPYKVFNSFSNYLISYNNLLNENTKLQTRQLLLEAKIQQLSSLENENTQLHELLNASKTIPHNNNKIIVAQILNINSNPFDQEIVIDKGQNYDLYVGQPIIDAHGLIGQIISVNAITSRAVLLTSSKSAIPVENGRNGIRGIAVGNGTTDTISLAYMPNTADIQIGDLFTTSGLGTKFPKGYAVGKVISIEYPVKERFAVIKLAPAANLNKLNKILLTWFTSPSNDSKHDEHNN